MISTDGTRPMIAGNWKMHGCRAALDEILAIDRAAARYRAAEVVVCPPFPLLSQAAQSVSHVAIGAQDCHAEQGGAYTGGVSAGMIQDTGARWVIIGHSECRQALDHDNNLVAAKARAAQGAGLNVILCVGEPEGFDAHAGGAFIVGQMISSLPTEVDTARLVIAYEPIWAIGSGRTPTCDEIEAALSTLGHALQHRFGAESARIRLLYGGSVNQDNARDILGTPQVGGLLVGGASLSANAFIPVISAAGRPKLRIALAR